MQPHRLPTPLLALALLVPTTITALTLPHSTLHNLTVHSHTRLTNLTGWSIRNCVADPTWNPPSLLISPDCESALLQLEDDGSTFGPHPGKFTYNDGDSSALFSQAHSSKELRVPKRYVSGQCVVAIVMMKMFEEKGLQVPGLPMGAWPDAEEVGWGEMVQGGSYVRATCANGCGYATVGREDGVAVVIWEVGSKWDRFVKGLGEDVATA